MIQKSIQITLILLLICVSSCKKDVKRTEAERIVTEWVGKEIVFPADVPCMYMGEDTVCPEMNTPYNVLVYTDSVGCTSCKSYLNEWSFILKETEQLGLEQACFLFYFQPKSRKELEILLKKDEFRQIVFADYADKLNVLNKFSTRREHQNLLASIM